VHTVQRVGATGAPDCSGAECKGAPERKVLARKERSDGRLTGLIK